MHYFKMMMNIMMTSFCNRSLFQNGDECYGEIVLLYLIGRNCCGRKSREFANFVTFKSGIPLNF